MIIPVRCFTCGKLVGDQWDEFTRRIKTGENASDILDSLGLKRYCCRRMLLSNVEIIDEVLRFYEEAEKRKEARNLYQFFFKKKIIVYFVSTNCLQSCLVIQQQLRCHLCSVCLSCFFGLGLVLFSGCVKKRQNTSRNVKFR